MTPEIAGPESLTDDAQELDIRTVERLEERAMAYLETAEGALNSFNGYADYLITLHPEKFAGIGMRDADLSMMAKFGGSLKVGSDRWSSDQPNSRTKVPRELDDFMRTYKGLGDSEIATATMDPETGQRIEELAATAPTLPAEKANLDAYVSELDIATRNIPALYDTTALIGLSVVRLSQFCQQDIVQEHLPDNLSVSANFRNMRPAMQGAYLASAHYALNTITGLQTTLRDMLPSLADQPEEQEKIVNSYSAEVQLVEQRTQFMKDRHHKVAAAYKTVIDSALEQAAEAMQELAVMMPTPDTIDSNSGPENALEAENKAIKTNRRVARRAKSIVEIANSLQRQGTLTTPEFSFPKPFPAIEATLGNRVKQLEASQIAGTLATNRSAQEQQVQALLAELTELQAPYRMTRPEIKKIPDSNELTAQLIKGLVGDEESRAEAVSKEDAYDIAGLIFKLNEQLDSRVRNTVFDQLFEAYGKEGAPVAQLGGHAADFSLAASCDWLINNVANLQSSELESLSRLGDELAIYGRMRRTPVGQRLERAARQVSEETLQAIEALRTDTEPLDIRAFPPGISNREMLEEDALELATRPGRQKIPILDGARLVAMDELSVAYSEAGHDTQLFRLLPGSLRERFPYYALIVSAREHKVVIAENPKINNATYVFEELDPELAAWEEIVQLDKKAVRELGGRAMRHDPEQSLQDHFKRVGEEVILRLSS